MQVFGKKSAGGLIVIEYATLLTAKRLHVVPFSFYLAFTIYSGAGCLQPFSVDILSVA